MRERVTPMIHVPNVRETADWYVAIGFTLVRTHEDPSEVGGLSWALLSFGAAELMLNAGGKPSEAPRRELDLYVHVANIDAIAARLVESAEIVEDVHETFYGMREMIVRDPNGFWITFGHSLSG